MLKEPVPAGHTGGIAVRSIFLGLTQGVVLCLLAACGGGGGGDGGGGDAGATGRLSVSTHQLTFVANGPNGATPPAQTVTGFVNDFPGGTLYLTITGTGQAVASISPVVLTSSTSGYAEVSVPSPATLGVGTYTGLINVQACTSGTTCASGNLNSSPQTINVTYHVAAVQSSAGSLDFSIANVSAAEDLRREVTLTTVPSNQTWTAAVDANWLHVTASGASGGTLAATLDPDVLQGLTNGQYTASVTVTPGTYGPPLVLPVTLDVQRTQIDHVTPYVAYTGTSQEVIIRGQQLSQLQIGNVLFGSTPALSFTLVSDTEIRATTPAALARGRHTVHLQSAQGSAHELAELVVVDAPAFSAAVLAYPQADLQAPNTIIYDAERAALAVSTWHTTGSTSFIHYRSTPTGWAAPTYIEPSNNFGFALTADGKEWILGSNKNVVHVNAGDLSTVDTLPSFVPPSGTNDQVNFSVASDGTIAMLGDEYYGCGALIGLYDPRKQRFRTSPYRPCQANMAASGDGSRIIVSLRFDALASDDVMSLDVASGGASATGIHSLNNFSPVLDRRGTRIVIGRTQVYNGAYLLLGTLPSTTQAVVLRPDGTRAYTFDHSGRLRTFDLTATPAGGAFPELGIGITLAGDPGRDQKAIYSDAFVEMAITPDGRTVFIAGSKAVVVQPVP